MQSTVPNRMKTLATSTDGKNIDQGSHVNEVVKIQEQEVPQQLENNETLVEVRYVGISPADVTCLRIQHKNTTPGFDLAGVVVKDKSGRWKEGDRVFGLVYGGLGSTLRDNKVRKERENNGAYAEYAVVCSDFLVRIPDNGSFEKTSALPFANLSAFQAFGFKHWPPSRSENHEPILICGGSSMIGLCAIQIAHHLGYRVLVTTTQEHFELCRQFGADECYNYKEANIDQRIRDDSQNNLQFAIDSVCMGNSTTIAYKAMGAKGGEIRTVLPRDQREMGVQRNDIEISMRLPTTLWGEEATWEGINFKPMNNEHSNAKAFLRDLGDYLKEGKYRYLPTRVQGNHGLDGVLEGLESVRRTHPSGVRLVACINDH